MKLTVFAVLLVQGFAGLVNEVVFLLLAAVLFGSSMVASSLILALFLAGLALGALVGRSLLRRPEHLPQIFAGLNLLAGLSTAAFLGLVVLLEALGPALAEVGFCTLVLVTPMCGGAMIPVAVRLLETHGAEAPAGSVYFANGIGSVLGALTAGLLIVPALGFQGALWLGAGLSLATAAILVVAKRQLVAGGAALAVMGGLGFAVVGQAKANDLSFFRGAYGRELGGESVVTRLSPYQHIAVTKHPRFGKQLYLNGVNQVSETDSATYHEMQVLPALAAHADPRRVLVVGDGDGGAIFELLKAGIGDVDHVDLDETVIEVARDYLPEINHGALDDPRVHRFITDGRRFLRTAPPASYDVVILALTDPDELELTSLYSRELYRLVQSRLRPGGVMVTQSGPVVGRDRAQACLLKTVRQVFTYARWYSVAIESWDDYAGFVIAADRADPAEVRNSHPAEGRTYHVANQQRFLWVPDGIARALLNPRLDVNTDTEPALYLDFLRDALAAHAPGSRSGAESQRERSRSPR